MRVFGIVAVVCSVVLPGLQAESDELTDPPGIQALRYRLVGPAWPGRMTRVSGVAGTGILYAGAATGGLWKSINSGLSWEPIFDSTNECCVGSLALAPSDPNVIYVGAGEANIRGVAIAGHGIYKSVDAGKTWSHVWRQSGMIGAMVVHPANSDIAFAAVLGHAFGPNPERGVYRTIDGGKTWTQVLKHDENTGAADIAFDPANPNHLLASLWQAGRTPWSMESGGPGSGLYTSMDGGSTWSRITHPGLPQALLGKIGVAFAPSRPQRVYALIEADDGGLFRSDDSGKTWERVNSNTALLRKAYYFTTVIVSPANPDEVWLPQRDMFRSRDGGRTFAAVPGTRNGDDFHDVFIDPAHPLHILLGLDSGVQVSLDGGAVWYTPPLPLSQLYSIDVSQEEPFRIAGTIQDVGTTHGPSNSLDRGGIRNSDWRAVGGGEAGPMIIDKSDPNVIYSGNYASSLTRFDLRTRQTANVTVFPVLPQGLGAADLKYRFQYSAPLAASPFDSKVLYHGANVLFRSEDGGLHWKPISGDLTRNDKSKQQRTSGLFAWDNVSVEHYCTLIAIAESPLRKGVIWTGSDDGLVHVTVDGGKTWRNVTTNMPGFPEWGSVTTIEPSRYEAATAYVIVDTYRLDKPEPFLFKTKDYGQTWQRLDGGLPRDLNLRVVREDPVQSSMLYLGTGNGVAYSQDGGATWNSLRLNLPPVPVWDLKVKSDSLIVGTYGRSFWVFDHLAALRQLQPHNEASTRLFAPSDTIRWRYSSLVAVPGNGGLGTPEIWKGTNPPQGAYLYYWLQERPHGEIEMEILDANQRIVNRMTSTPLKSTGYTDNLAPELPAELTANPGLNVAVWNFAYEGAKAIADSKVKTGNPSAGPLALGGTYIVRMRVDGRTFTTHLRLSMDPRVQTSISELQKRLDLALAIREQITHLSGLVSELREFRAHAAARPGSDDRKNLLARLDDLELRMHNARAEVVYDLHTDPKGVRLYGQLVALYSFAMDSDTPLPQGLRDTFTDESKELRGYEDELRNLLTQRAVSGVQ